MIQPARDDAEIGEAFSITLRVRDRRPVFPDLHFGRYCLGYLCALRRIVGHRVFAYCLMPDHVHLLVMTGPCGTVENFVWRWKSLCTFEWRRRTDKGSFWQPGALDRVERVEQGVRELARRVLENPVRSGLVWKPEDYPLSGSFEKLPVPLESRLPPRGAMPEGTRSARGRLRPASTSS